MNALSVESPSQAYYMHADVFSSLKKKKKPLTHMHIHIKATKNHVMQINASLFFCVLNTKVYKFAVIITQGLWLQAS